MKADHYHTLAKFLSFNHPSGHQIPLEPLYNGAVQRPGAQRYSGISLDWARPSKHPAVEETVLRMEFS